MHVLAQLHILFGHIRLRLQLLIAALQLYETKRIQFTVLPLEQGKFVCYLADRHFYEVFLHNIISYSLALGRLKETDCPLVCVWFLY